MWSDQRKSFIHISASLSTIRLMSLLALFCKKVFCFVWKSMGTHSASHAIIWTLHLYCACWQVVHCIANLLSCIPSKIHGSWWGQHWPEFPFPSFTRRICSLVSTNSSFGTGINHGAVCAGLKEIFSFVQPKLLTDRKWAFRDSCNREIKFDGRQNDGDHTNNYIWYCIQLNLLSQSTTQNAFT